MHQTRDECDFWLTMKTIKTVNLIFVFMSFVGYCLRILLLRVFGLSKCDFQTHSLLIILYLKIIFYPFICIFRNFILNYNRLQHNPQNLILLLDGATTKTIILIFEIKGKILLFFVVYYF